MQRALTILAIVIVLTGIAGAVYYFYFFRHSATVTVSQSGGATLPSVGQASTVGQQSTTTLPATSGATSGPVLVSPRLVEISSGPIVPGMVVVDTKLDVAGTSTVAVVTFINRQSGNVYSYTAGTNTLTRTSNKTVPGIQSAAWLPDGSRAFVRYLTGTDFSIINTYALSSIGLSGFFLSQNLADIAVSSTSVLTLASGVNGSVASLSRTDGTRATSLFTSPLASLRVSFAGKGQYLAFTKPSGLLAGDAFLVDSAGRFSRVAGPLNGIVALASPSGKWVLVSATSAGVMQMALINSATGENLPLPVATIADKCVWTANESVIYCGIPVDPTPNALYPDDWYQGAVHFTDRIWKIQVAGRYAELVLDFSKDTKGSLDTTALAINAKNSLLTFVNKNDGSLWSFSL